MPAQVPLPPELHELRHKVLGMLQQTYAICFLVRDDQSIQGQSKDLINKLLQHARDAKDTINQLFDGLATMKVPSLKVLVVEDDPLNRQFVRKVLEASGHVVVGEADTAAQMVDRAINSDVDLIVFDIRLKGEQTGLDALEEIKQFRVMPAVAITGYKDVAAAFRAAEHNALGYLTKPVDNIELIVAVSVAYRNYKEILSLKTQAEESKVAFERLKIVNRAKAILQKKNRWTEDDAFFWLQQLAMRSGMKIEVVAQDLVEGTLHPHLMNTSLADLRRLKAARTL